MDAVEDILERVGRLAVGKVNGTKITVSVNKRTKAPGLLFPPLLPRRPYWTLVTDAPDLWAAFGEFRNVRRFDDKAEAIAEFEALVKKYGLVEEK